MHESRFIYIVKVFLILNFENVYGSIGIFPEIPATVPQSKHAECKRHSEQVLANLNNMTSWAYRMWDATARAELGIIEGNLYQLGNFDECFNEEIPFETQYCLTRIYLDVSKIPKQCTLREGCNNVYDEIRPRKDIVRMPRDEIRWAICAPASCGRKELKAVIQEALNNHNSSFEYKVDILSDDCQLNSSLEPWTFEDISFVLVLIILVLAVIQCTILHSKGHVDKIVRVFSIHESWKELARSENNRALSMLNGVRVLLSFGIVMGHSINMIWCGPVLNQLDLETEEKKLTSTYFLRGDCTVDVYLMIGGLLSAYTQMSKAPNFMKAIVTRYLRIVPLLLLTSLYYITIFPKLGSGPLWNQLVRPESEYCKRNWWTNVVFLNNYIDTENLCVLQSYYLPIDFHLFLLSIPLCWLFRNTKKWGYIVTSACALFCIIYTFVICYMYQIKPFYYPYNDYYYRLRQDPVFKSIYIPTHARGSSYFIGMLFGVNYYHLKRIDNMRVSNGKSIFAMIIIFIGMNLSLMTTILFLNPNVYTVWHAIYAAVHRPFYAFTVGCGLLLISYTKLPLMRASFKWVPWVSVARLTFGVYFFHVSLQFQTVASHRTPQKLTYLFVLSNTVHEFAWSFLASVLLYFFVEGPFGRITRLYWPEKPVPKVPRVDYGEITTKF